MIQDDFTFVQRWTRFALCVAIGAVVWFIPVPQDVKPQAWRLFAVFVTVIASFLLRPFPMGPMVLFGLVFATAGKVITIKEALVGFSDDTVWLVVAAFLFAGAVVRTGLGYRIALTLVVKLGKSILGLGYAICSAEFILGPIIPSNTARGGGVLAPIVRSLAEALDSFPDHQPERAGRYLVSVGGHANLIAAAMFMTGMAANPLVAAAAADVFGIEFTWNHWALGAIVPGIISFAGLPLLMYFLMRPSITDVEAARLAAKDQLDKMGSWTLREIGMTAIFALMIFFWMSKSLHGMGTSLVAWLGVALLLLTWIEKWDDIVSNKSAWDALIWLGGLLTMANLLRDYGLIDWFARASGVWVGGLNGIFVVIALALIYFYSMYGFSMLTGHISAMVAAFFAVCLAAGAPPMMTVALFAYFSNLCGCLTNYSSGPVIIYFGFGYTSASQWLSRGAIVSVYHLTVWLGIGFAWWKLLGWW